MEQPFPAYKGDDPYVFVCYAHADREVVYDDLRWMQDQGERIWYDEGIATGRRWRAELADAIDGASYCLFFVSDNSISSPYCSQEVNYAIDQGKVVVPIFLNEAKLSKELQLGIGNIQGVERRGDVAIYRARLLMLNPGELHESPRVARLKLGITVYVAAAVVVAIAASLYWLTSTDLEDERPAAAVSYDERDRALVNAVLPLVGLSGRYDFHVIQSDDPPIDTELVLAFWCSHIDVAGARRQLRNALEIGADVILILLDRTPLPVDQASWRQIDLSGLIGGAHSEIANESPSSIMAVPDALELANALRPVLQLRRQAPARDQDARGRELSAILEAQLPLTSESTVALLDAIDILEWEFNQHATTGAEPIGNEPGLEAQRARQRLDDLERQIADRLANATLTALWDWSISRLIAEYGEVVGQGSRELNARRQRVAELYAQDAQRMREDSRLANARQQLDKAARFAPDLPLIQEERLALLAQQGAQVAGYGELMLELEESAKVGNMDAAVALLGQLRSSIPSDPFVTDTAPRRIAAGYAALGLRQAGSSSTLRDAGQLLDRAREWSTMVPEVAELEGAINAQAEKMLGSIEKAMLADAPPNVPVISDWIAAIESSAPDVYDEKSPAVMASIVSRIESLSPSSRARKRLEEAQEIFSDFPDVAIDGGAPVVAGDPCARPDLVGNGSRRGGSCRDTLPGGNRGPALVVLPAGGPFSSAVAFSKFEITVRDYNVYCEQIGNCTPLPGNPKLPLTQVSIDEAERFVDWLGLASGASYRLPNASEWEYAANANGAQPTHNWNCRVRQNNVLIKGIDLVSVDTGEGNGWGLYNYVGNAQEWVRNGLDLEVRGGAFEDPIEVCEIELAGPHNGKPDRLTGFRVLREIR